MRGKKMYLCQGCGCHVRREAGSTCPCCGTVAGATEGQQAIAVALATMGLMGFAGCENDPPPEGSSSASTTAMSSSTTTTGHMAGYTVAQAVNTVGTGGNGGQGGDPGGTGGNGGNGGDAGGNGGDAPTGGGGGN